MTVSVIEGATLAELQAHRDALRAALKRVEAVRANCHSCGLFELGACQVHGQVPEAFQLAEGECAEWRYDGVPF